MLPGMLAEPGLFMAGDQPIQLAGRYAGRGVGTLALRPERLRLSAGAQPGNVTGVVELASYLGPVREHVLRLGPDLRLIVRGAHHRRRPIGPDRQPRDAALGCRRRACVRRRRRARSKPANCNL